MADDVEPRPWGRTTITDLKNKMMVFLRDGQIDALDETIKKVKEGGPNGERIVVEALQTKSFEDGRNLLMQAAAYGKKDGFLTLVKALHERENLGHFAFVRQLRDVDKDGAPLLFHAAASDDIDCLKMVIRVLENFLGKEGFKKQLNAIDHEGRNVLMFAVRSPNCKVYDKIVKVLGKNGDRRSRSFDKQDKTLRSLLHHAAEGECPEILQKVVNRLKDCPRSFKELVAGADKKGRTPIMHVLRDSYRIRQMMLTCDNIQTYGSSLCRSSTIEMNQNWEKEDVQRAEQRKKKLDILMSGMETGEQLRSLTQPSKVNESVGCESTRSDRTALMRTALMHAARGGLAAFNLTVKKIQELKARDECLSHQLDSAFLDQALGVDMLVEGGHGERVRRRGMLVEEAAIGGDLKVMDRVFMAIDPSEVLESIYARGSCLFTAAIKSCNKQMVERIAEFIIHHYENDSGKAWESLRGNASKKSSLACAASTPATVKEKGCGIFDQVHQCLWEAALNLEPENAEQRMREELVVTKKPVSPLGAAVLQSNKALFWKVYYAYKKRKGRWNRQKIWNQLRKETKDTQDTPDADTIAVVPAQMWHTVAEAFERTREDQPWARWRDYFSPTIRTLVERGDFAQMRALAKEKFPLHTHIPVLLERIGDCEENVIETVTLVVVHASNPLVVWAGASRDIMEAEVNLPMYKHGLRRLRDRLDTLITQLLDQLPHTVRGVGRELPASDELYNAASSPASGDLKQHRSLDQMIEYTGYNFVRWMLEPSLASGASESGKNGNTNDMLDPLQHALDRGSNCLPFVNSALVLDYLHLQFWNSLPSWTARNSFHDAIFMKFYAYKESWLQTGAGELLRFLQGWDKDGDMSTPDELAFSFPHSTLLPGLQFTLAGMIGKPADFFAVPFVRFIFELMSYIVMLGLFCASVSIQNSDEIPPQECVFYIFVLGLFWREFLEFKEALPARHDVVEDKAPSSPEGSERKSVWCLPCSKGRLTKHPHGVASAISRYLFYDTWNILDIITVVVVAAAFVFRILALGEGWSADEQTSSTPSTFSQNYIFSAQLCLSFSAPLLFSRVLFLSQIDATLGPMTQVIWVMMSHLARFTVFLLVVMASFALAFHTLFFTCKGVEPSLEDAFGTFGKSLLTMFESMLGSFDFDMLLAANECNRPRWAYEVSLWLLVSYMIIMAILLLNLLIAVMTTAHSAVDAHTEEEFQLSRAKVILQTSRAVANGRLPAPCNLIGAVMGCLVDIPHAIRMLGYGLGKIFKDNNPAKLPPAGGPTAPVNDSSPKSNSPKNAKTRKDRTGRGAPECRSVDEEIDFEGDIRCFDSTPSALQSPNAAPASPATVSEVTPASDSASSNRGSSAYGSDMSSSQNGESFPSDLPAGEKTICCEPFTMSNSWQTVEGGRDRLIFAFTMGVTAVVATAILWVTSTPWLAWRILRWFFPAGPNIPRGYTWNVGSAVVKLLGWLMLLPVTLVYCCGCALASVILWLWGLCSVFEWVCWRFNDGNDEFVNRGYHFVQRGEERDTDGNKARDNTNDCSGVYLDRSHRSITPEERNTGNCTNNGTGGEQLNVGSLLKMTTGMDVEELAMVVKLKE